jgi:UDP-3-O-[3-hydroxymyristoyl] N-acetylglucosamine deacetylase
MFNGKGLHTGQFCKVVLTPSLPSSGIVFSKLNSANTREYKLTPYDIDATQLSTSVNIWGKNYLFTIEHIMSALFGMGIDNVKIYVKGPEIPALDGSSAPFVKAIKKSGIKIFPIKRYYLKIKKKLTLQFEDKWIEIIPSCSFKIFFKIDFKDTVINEQKAYYNITPKIYESCISKARTFGFKREISKLRNKHLALGGTLNNTIVVDNDKIINKRGLRYHNEFVRHKMLDLIGDLALINFRILGYIRAYKSGHVLNNLLSRTILSDRSNYDLIELNSLNKENSY